ncbi:MAG: zf-TFIIB domain-containing protein [Sedimentisphaerales bacterium]|nr:zf-TFIIB domain-containing protein [Sedimentisphaerales bacterium]
MICPACGNRLQKMSVSEVELDVCSRGCGGIWFDNYELQKFDEPFEPTEDLLQIEPKSGVTVDPSQRRQCPKCDNITMLRHFFSVKHQVEIDECQSCGGVWLDYGELEAIRNLFGSEQERHQAAQEAFDKQFAEVLATDWKQSEERLAKARQIANAFRFICPSYYIPGKQSWGAF